MERTEMESLVKQLKAAGLTEEQIMETFYETFQEGKMDRKDLEACAEFMGYELTDDFKNDPTPDPIAAPEGEGGEGITKEEAEAAKEIKPGESAEEFKEAVEGGEPKGEEPKAPEAPKAPSEEPKAEPEKPESKSNEEIDEDKEWEEVQKKFNW